jgi:hypothetical protein
MIEGVGSRSSCAFPKYHLSETLSQARAAGFLSIKAAAPDSFIHDHVQKVRAKDSSSRHQFGGAEICGNNFCIFYTLVKRWKAIPQKLLDHVE